MSSEPIFIDHELASIELQHYSISLNLGTHSISLNCEFVIREPDGTISAVDPCDRSSDLRPLWRLVQQRCRKIGLVGTDLEIQFETAVITVSHRGRPFELVNYYTNLDDNYILQRYPADWLDF